MTTRSSVVFVSPRTIEIQQEKLAMPGPGLVLVGAEVSAISPATELLMYRGQVPEVEAMLGFPTKFGFSVVGRVLETGEGVAPNWKGKRVFACHPHESHFLAQPRDLLLLPDEVNPEAGVFLTSLEMAVQLLHDGRPVLGERVAVFGQTLVGLLTVALLRKFPLVEVISCDGVESRRALSLEWGAHRTFDTQTLAELRNCDLTYELSGHPETLSQAIKVTGFSGRVVIGSWYGTRRAEAELGGAFQRSRVHILSSHLSNSETSLNGSWTQERRTLVALDLLSVLKPERLITHRFPATAAGEAFDFLDQAGEEPVQVVLTY